MGNFHFDVTDNRKRNMNVFGAVKFNFFFNFPNPTDDAGNAVHG